jgi:hypothetical protein
LAFERRKLSLGDLAGFFQGGELGPELVERYETFGGHILEGGTLVVHFGELLQPSFRFAVGVAAEALALGLITAPSRRFPDWRVMLTSAGWRTSSSMVGWCGEGRGPLRLATEGIGGAGSVIPVLPADSHVMRQGILADGGMVRML